MQNSIFIHKIVSKQQNSHFFDNPFKCQQLIFKWKEYLKISINSDKFAVNSFKTFFFIFLNKRCLSKYLSFFVAKLLTNFRLSSSKKSKHSISISFFIPLLFLIFEIFFFSFPYWLILFELPFLTYKKFPSQVSYSSW